MRKQVFGRRLKRDKNERKALFSGLISAMVLKGNIITTEEKAKAIRPSIEKLVTKAKKGDSSRRLLQPHLKPYEIEKIIKQIAPAFKDINGGYTRIIKTGRRFSDNASMATMQWTQEIVKADKPPVKDKKVKDPKSKTKTSKSTTKPVNKPAGKGSKPSIAKAKEDK